MQLLRRKLKKKKRMAPVRVKNFCLGENSFDYQRRHELTLKNKCPTIIYLAMQKKIDLKKKNKAIMHAIFCMGQESPTSIKTNPNRYNVNILKLSMRSGKNYTFQHFCFKKFN